jgi:hypothetical protein
VRRIMRNAIVAIFENQEMLQLKSIVTGEMQGRFGPLDRPRCTGPQSRYHLT